MRKKLKKIFLSYWPTVLIATVFFFRLPSLFEPFVYGDEGIYLTLGQALRKGLVFYQDIHDNKPPLLYFLAAFAGNFSTYRLILFIWSFATIWLFYKLSLLLFPKSKYPRIFSTFLFAFLISIRTFEGDIANAENFMLLPIIAGFYLYLKAKKWFHYFFAGIFFSLATLFKIPAAFDFLALLVFAPFKAFGQKRRNYFQLITGFSLPVLTMTVYYASKNALNQYLTAAFSQNLPYLSSWTPDKPKMTGLPLSLLSRAILVLLVFVLVFALRKKISLAAKLIIIWFSFSLFAVLLSSRPYPHYLLQTIPVLALSFGLLLSKNKEKIIPAILSAAFVFSFLFFKFWHYPNLSYYLNFYQFALQQKSKESYFNYFGGQTKALYQTAAFLKSHTLPEEKIFIWGNHPSIYALANRLPVGRYTVAYHIIDFNGYQETMEALTKNPPRYTVVSDEEKRPFPSFFAFLQNNYTLALRMGNLQIFRLIYKFP